MMYFAYNYKALNINEFKSDKKTKGFLMIISNQKQDK
jgi:hypothetical protein